VSKAKIIAVVVALLASPVSAAERPEWLEDDAMLRKDISEAMAIGIADDLRRTVQKRGLPCNRVNEAQLSLFGYYRLTCDSWTHAYTLRGDYGKWEIEIR
jgi:hypothetical protein